MSPILNQISTVFIPVRDIEKAREWYCEVLRYIRIACRWRNFIWASVYHSDEWDTYCAGQQNLF